MAKQRLGDFCLARSGDKGDGSNVGIFAKTDADYAWLVEHESAVFTDGSFVYDPSPDFKGADSFTYIASDGQTSSRPATVSLFVGERIAPALDSAVNDIRGKNAKRSHRSDESRPMPDTVHADDWGIVIPNLRRVEFSDRARLVIDKAIEELNCERSFEETDLIVDFLRKR